MCEAGVKDANHHMTSCLATKYSWIWWKQQVNVLKYEQMPLFLWILCTIHFAWYCNTDLGGSGGVKVKLIVCGARLEVQGSISGLYDFRE